MGETYIQYVSTAGGSNSITEPVHVLMELCVQWGRLKGKCPFFSTLSFPQLHTLASKWLHAHHKSYLKFCKILHKAKVNHTHGLSFGGRLINLPRTTEGLWRMNPVHPLAGVWAQKQEDRSGPILWKRVTEDLPLGADKPGPECGLPHLWATRDPSQATVAPWVLVPPHGDWESWLDCFTLWGSNKMMFGKNSVRSVASRKQLIVSELLPPRAPGTVQESSPTPPQMH